ncbi:MAG: hypothetical protein KJO15_02145 [Alphaproteobacteria bacterium]|nr:hypothetical protein [Alphaproteobacteria bacterium]
MFFKPRFNEARGLCAGKAPVIAGVFTALALSIPASTATAEELTTLTETLNEVSDVTYPLVRCAALYASVVDNPGLFGLGNGTQSYRDAVAELMRTSAQLRSQKNPDKVALEEVRVNEEMVVLEALYQQRYRTASNLPLSEGDQLVAADLDTCDTIMALVTAR